MTSLRSDSIDEDHYTPYDQGWDAFLLSTRESRNPWAINNWKHYDWQEGWHACEDQKQDQPPAMH